MRFEIRRKILYLFVVLSFIGFVDATYLTVLHYLGEIPPCSIVKGCEIVTTSAYSVVAGVPVALMGSVYYLVVFFVSLYVLHTGRKDILKKLVTLTWCGLLASAVFLYLQLFVIGAICLYCIGSIITSTAIWIAARFCFSDRESHP